MPPPETQPVETQYASKSEALWANVVSPAGYVLAVSYPILALSTGVRAIYQLFFKAGVDNYLPVYLSALAALLLPDRHARLCLPPALDVVALGRRPRLRDVDDADHRRVELH